MGCASESRLVMSNSLGPHGLYSLWNSSDQSTGVGSLSLLQGIFPTQGSNPGPPHWRWILYQLSRKESPRILEWVAYPFSRGFPNPGIELGSPALQADSLPTELWGKPMRWDIYMPIYMWGGIYIGKYIMPEKGYTKVHFFVVLKPTERRVVI